MPRITNIQMKSAYDQMRQQARQLLVKLRSEIHAKEGDLRRLRAEASKLVGLTTQRGISKSNGGRPTASGSTRRINWGVVLEKLPEQFRDSDIRAVDGIEASGPRNFSRRSAAGWRQVL
jgi:hypothetical protein